MKEDGPHIDVGRRIKSARESKGLDTAMKLSIAMGPDEGGRYLSTSTISKWERGKQLPERHMAKLCRVLGVSIDWLAYGDAGAPQSGPSQAELEQAQRLLEGAGFNVRRVAQQGSGVRALMEPAVDQRKKAAKR